MGGFGGGNGGGGAAVLITSGTLGAGVATIDITSIPSGYSRFELQVSGGATDGTTDYPNLRLNADAGANYDGVIVRSTGAAVSTTTRLAANEFQIQQWGKSSDKVSSIKITIFNRNTGVLGKPILAEWYAKGNTYPHESEYGAWLNLTDEINRITLAAAVANYTTGTSYALFGYK